MLTNRPKPAPDDSGSEAATRASDPAGHISLCETLDRVLTKGVVVSGEVLISVANVDLIYLGLQLVLTSVETARKEGLTGLRGVAGEHTADRHGRTETAGGTRHGG